MSFNFAVKRLIAENSENLELSEKEKKFCKYAAFQAYNLYNNVLKYNNNSFNDRYNVGRELSKIFKRLFGFDFNPGKDWILGGVSLLEVKENIVSDEDMAYLSSVLNKGFYKFSDIMRHTYRAYAAVGSMDREDLDDRGVRFMGRIFVRVLESFTGKGNKKLDEYAVIRKMKKSTEKRFGNILRSM